MLKGILISLFFFSILIGTLTAYQQPTITVQNNTTPITFNPHAEFNKIYHTPYNEQTYNCLNKSIDFAIYLKNNNQTNIEYVNIAYKTGAYSHQFVLWNGQVYDPTSGVYNDTEQGYINELENMGFTGVIYTSPA